MKEGRRGQIAGVCGNRSAACTHRNWMGGVEKIKDDFEAFGFSH